MTTCELSVPTLEEEKLLFTRFNESDREALILRNMPMVVLLVKPYISVSDSLGCSYKELLSYGNLGLIKAVDHYKLNKGTRFFTYAKHWIKCELLECIRFYSGIKKHDFQKNNKITNLLESLTSELGRKPDINELAEEANMSKELIKRYSEKIRFVSLDMPVSSSDEETFSLSDVISDGSELQNETYEKKEKYSLSHKILDVCTPRQKEALMLFYGLTTNQSKKQKEIGHIMNVSRARVGQLIESGIRAIKRNKEKFTELN